MQNDYYWDDEFEPPEQAPSRTRTWIPIFLLGSLIACILGALLIPSGLGFVVGYQELQTQNHEAAIAHFNRGLGYLAESYPELARTEFEIALKFDGEFGPAKQKLDEMQGVAGKGTPEPSQDDRVAATLFDEANALVAQKQWSDAITRLEQLRTLKSDYRKTEVSDLLYRAYVSGGRDLAATGRVELARERFDAALAIRNGDPEIVKQRDRAVLYLDGRQAFGYNWQTAINKFSALYQQDPNYNDVRRLLYEAYIQHGDLAMKQGSPCLAVRDYDGALALTNDPAVAQKRSQTMAQCKQAISATPTPVGIENYTSKIAIAYDKACPNGGEIAGIVRDVQGRPVANISVGYYADGIPLVARRTDFNGQYQFTLGKDAGVFHVIIVGTDGKTPASLSADVPYPGNAVLGCRITVDWQKMQ